MDKEIIFDDERKVNALHIEDKKKFSKIVFDFYNLCNGSIEYEGIAITDENMESRIKDCLILWDLFNTNYNNKKVTNAVIKYINEELNNDAEQIKEFLKHFKCCADIIEEILLELPMEVEFNREYNVSDFCKALSLEVVDTTSVTLVDKLHSYIDIIKFSGTANLLILVNIKQFFDKKELVEIYKYVIYNEINILLLESSSCTEALEYEHVILIDEDYEEFEF